MAANRNDIDYFTINSAGNATDFGDLTAARREVYGCDNGENERGITAGGFTSNESNIIDYVTINSTGNATDFGNLVYTMRMGGGTSNRTLERGIFGGGYDTAPAPDHYNIIQYITINSAGNATDFGDLNANTYNLGATSNA